MGQDHCFGGCHQLMVQRLIPLLFGVANLIDGPFVSSYHAGGNHIPQRHLPGIDFVEGKPILHLSPIPGKDHLYKPQKTINGFPIEPAVVSAGQQIGHFIVGDGHQRLNTMSFAFLKDFVVKLQSLFVGSLLQTSGEDP